MFQFLIVLFNFYNCKQIFSVLSSFLSRDSCSRWINTQKPSYTQQKMFHRVWQQQLQTTTTTTAIRRRRRDCIQGHNIWKPLSIAIASILELLLLAVPADVALPSLSLLSLSRENKKKPLRGKMHFRSCSFSTRHIYSCQREKRWKENENSST